MKGYEYKEVSVAEQDLIAMLNIEGGNGWQAVSVRYVEGEDSFLSNQDMATAILMRPRQHCPRQAH